MKTKMTKRGLSANQAEKIVIVVLTIILIASLLVLVKIDRRRRPSVNTPPGSIIVD